MFSGIVEATGRVVLSAKNEGSKKLRVGIPARFRPLKAGESLSVNGCCLTVTQRKRGVVAFDLSSETLKSTSLGQLRPGDPVNLERSLQLSDRLGGHLVLGHVDGKGKVLSRRGNGSGIGLEVQFPSRLRRYLVSKGSVAVDGVSLTLQRIEGNRFWISIIPETLRRTSFSRLKRGDWVNLEVDIVGKYIESFLRRGRKG